MAEDNKVLELLKLNPGVMLEWCDRQKGYVIHTNKQNLELPSGGVRIVNGYIHAGKMLIMING